MIRQILKNTIKAQLEIDSNPALLLSGGLDSLSILLACLDIGFKPHCYTFYLDNYISEDLLSCRKLRDIYGFKLTEVVINTSEVDVYRDCIDILREHAHLEHTTKHTKTFVQCYQPMLYLLPYITETTVLSGIFGDTLQFNSRKFAVASKNMPYTELNDIRINKLKNPYSNSYKPVYDLFAREYKIFKAVYLEKNVQDYFLEKNYLACMKPKRKNLVYESFKDEIDKYKLYRTPSGYQVNSHIREWHDDALLNNTEININNNKAVIGIYNRILREIKEK